MNLGRKSKKRHLNHNFKGVGEVQYVAAYSNPKDLLLEGEEVKYSEEYDSYIMDIAPIWYSVKDFLISEVEPYL